MPHVIVAGATGAGKSVGVNVMLCSLLFRRSPEELRLLMIDPKVVELAPFDDYYRGRPANGIVDAVEDRPALMRGAAFAGRDPADDFGSIGCCRFGVERPLAARQPLHEQPGIPVE